MVPSVHRSWQAREVAPSWWTSASTSIFEMNKREGERRREQKNERAEGREECSTFHSFRVEMYSFDSRIMLAYIFLDLKLFYFAKRSKELCLRIDTRTNKLGWRAKCKLSAGRELVLGLALVLALFRFQLERLMESSRTSSEEASVKNLRWGIFVVKNHQKRKPHPANLTQRLPQRDCWCYKFAKLKLY